jgi:hypothetical protein
LPGACLDLTVSRPFELFRRHIVKRDWIGWDGIGLDWIGWDWIGFVKHELDMLVKAKTPFRVSRIPMEHGTY